MGTREGPGGTKQAREGDGHLSRVRVVYWNNIPSPYMVDRFNAIASRGTLDFEAWFNERTERDRSWAVEEGEWRFRYRYVKSVGLGKARLRFPPTLFKRNVPDVLVSLYAEPVFVFGWWLARTRGGKTIFWSQITFDEWVKRTRAKTLLKRWMFSRVDATLGAGKDSQARAISYGTDRSRARVLPHAIDYDFLAGEAAKYQESRTQIRDTIGVHGLTFIYVGRLWAGKGVMYLLQAFHKLQDTYGDTSSLLLVGDGPDEQRIRDYVRNHRIKSVYLVGFHQKPRLPYFYAAADVFVFPSLGDPYGLVIDEALASGLPVISTDRAGEVNSRIEHGKNGFIVDAGGMDSLFMTMRLFVLNRDLPSLLKPAVSADKWTPARWAAEFERIVVDVSSQERRN